MLEFGIATVVAPFAKFNDFLSKRERPFTSQSKDDSQEDVEGDKNDCHMIELEHTTMRGSSIDWEERFRVIEQQIREIKKERKAMKSQDNTIRQLTLPRSMKEI